MNLARWFAAFALAALACAARADAVDTLRAFVRDVQSGSADFTQTVTSPDGARTKTSSGSFEFARPNRFRFEYKKPFEQVIVADGQKVWIYDRDLNQVSSRKLSQAIGATPAALLAGGDLDKDFVLEALPDRDGLAWVEATPRAEGGTLQSVRVGFRGAELAAIEIRDAFGQTSLLRFGKMATNQPPSSSRFQFTIPPGADVIEQ
ncbi:MAG TPA: outer membrane lipoprotein chaperone LolA [Burkholderiaceae bacterium]|nr:outer membrane lipoprotein chaperone LolA [Burkholderiaceae bacterium]